MRHVCRDEKYKILVGKPKGKPGRRWEHNVIIDLERCEDVDWIGHDQVRV
jgi:hypothetical protein